jgi:hypothetical protein
VLIFCFASTVQQNCIPEEIKRMFATIQFRIFFVQVFYQETYALKHVKQLFYLQFRMGMILGFYRRAEHRFKGSESKIEIK